jgi:hypothetical protein
MNWQKALQAVVAIGAIGVLGLTGLASEDASILQGQRSLAPAGAELSDEELLAVDGDLAPLVLLALAVVGGAATGASVDLAWQVGFGGGDVNWSQVGYGAAMGAGTVLGAEGLPMAVSSPLLQSSLASALRWSAAAAAAAARGVGSAAQAAGSAVASGARATGSAIVSAARTAANAIVNTWNWFTRKP